MPPSAAMHDPHFDAVSHLAACHPAWAALIERIGSCTLQPVPREPWEALIRAVAHQQLHARAAEATLGRMLALFPGQCFPEPGQLLALEEGALRACGFSAAKVRAVQGIAGQTLAGVVPDALSAQGMSDEELIDRLTTLRGIGRWTVEMLLIFTLGRMDVLPVDDFGVREGWRILHGLDYQPRPRELAAAGKVCSPYRSVAAWYLWRAADAGKLA